MKKVLLIDGNSIMNRAFYGIMSNKMLTTDDGKYTNALYGFLSILFKNEEEVKPDYILIAFDSKTAANVRKNMYDGYKKNRHAMPEELREQMPEIKEILKAMNISYLELADYEGDDILGSFAKKFADDNTICYILSGDRDLFQLVQNNIIVRIPRTKMGKTETEIFDEENVEKEYGLKPKELIELKALMGDSSDEIPGCPGIGPKTATELLKKFKTIDGIYEALGDDEKQKEIKPKLREKLKENKGLVELSKKLGKINIEAPITDNIEDIKVKEWNYNEVYRLFKYYKFNRFITRFNLSKKVYENYVDSKENESSKSISTNESEDASDLYNNKEEKINISNAGINEKNKDTLNENITEKLLHENIKELIKIENVKNLEEIKIDKKLIYYLQKEDSKDNTKIVKKDIVGIGIREEETGKNYYIKDVSQEILKELFENENTEKIGFDVGEDYVLLKEMGINMKNIKYDAEIAAYDIDPTNIKHTLKEIAMQYVNFDIEMYIPEKQMNLFDDVENQNEVGVYLYAINKLYDETIKKLEENNSLKLFNEIEIPLIYVLGDMQFKGMLVDKNELIAFGETLKQSLEELTESIYELAGEEFNINSTIQLGNILFEKLKLPAPKKNKKGYSTDVETLEKIADKHPIVSKILEYRALTKLNSTYVEGLIPFINERTKRIHSHFHQTITATGRISSTDPNLQNIPSREELGRNIKKAFKPQEGYSYIDADYSQVELRVLAHMSNDENMRNAFLNDEDIHKQVASRVFNTPIDEVTKEERSKAKAVNFGIVYGITGFGLAKQISTSRKEADEYIKSYLEKYSGVKTFMDEMINKAKEYGYVETLFGRRRYIPELKSSNYMVREFGKRAAMNTPIQGTAADIMKIAMNKVEKALIENHLDAKIVLQVHDELLLEVKDEHKEKAKKILKECMENAYKMSIPLKVEVTEAKSWYDAK